MKAILTSGETIQVDHKGPGKWSVSTPDGHTFRIGILGTSEASEPEVWVGTETQTMMGVTITPVYDHGIRALILQGGMLTIIPQQPKPKDRLEEQHPPQRFVPYYSKGRTIDA